MELLSTAISYLNTYLLEKFSQKKYSTKLLVIFTITFLSFMLWQIYSGHNSLFASDFSYFRVDHSYIFIIVFYFYYKKSSKRKDDAK